MWDKVVLLAVWSCRKLTWRGATAVLEEIQATATVPVATVAQLALPALWPVRYPSLNCWPNRGPWLHSMLWPRWPLCRVWPIYWVGWLGAPRDLCKQQECIVNPTSLLDYVPPAHLPIITITKWKMTEINLLLIK